MHIIFYINPSNPVSPVSIVLPLHSHILPVLPHIFLTTILTGDNLNLQLMPPTKQLNLHNMLTK